MRKVLLIFFFIFYQISLQASVWQWSVEIEGFISSETNNHPRAFLWIPENCKQVKGVVFGQHNMCEETIFEHTYFRNTMADLSFAIIWITPGFEQQWDVKNGCQGLFDTMMNNLADISGYSELRTIPIVALGHSAMATFPWNFAAWNPDRTLAIISYHGNAPRTNLTGFGRENLEWGRTHNIDGIPGLMIEGEYEWWQARVNPALAFRMMYPKSCISFLCDVGHGHFDVSDEVVNYISLFLRKASHYRLPDNQVINNPVRLKTVDVTNGWLTECWHPGQSKCADPALYPQYKGDGHEAFWYFDKEMAESTETYYRNTRNKKDQYIGFFSKGKPIEYKDTHAGFNLDFEPESDGLTFHLSATFTDSLRKYISDKHSLIGKIVITRICGPVEVVNDTTFSIRFYRMGLHNAKRTNDIWLLAQNKGDIKYKSTVQQINIKIPYPQTKGKRQSIFFPSFEDIEGSTRRIALQAVSDRSLPVCYYIKEGPAIIKDNEIEITAIPPRAKFPVKVTVVAWQYGIEGVYRTAEPVEHSFYIRK
ncbi:MAG: hypothetical protein LBT43_01660 [Prevotella sp.]|jgi:hypothetical protein|nr:hypothetical protein [Prevotella sp.]